MLGTYHHHRHVDLTLLLSTHEIVSKILFLSGTYSLRALKAPWPLVRKRTIPTEATATCRRNLVPIFADIGM
jgi:hypothetical protein